jgi:catechol 2,3-dioxygenase-like lactoylglutathione lyase family enzyme
MAGMNTHSEATVAEMRLVVTADDYEEALVFYRDVLGLPPMAVFDSPGGRVTLLGAGRATLELTDTANAEYVDEVEVGRWVAGPIRVACEVLDTEAMTRRGRRRRSDRAGRADAHPVGLVERPRRGTGRSPAHAPLRRIRS